MDDVKAMILAAGLGTRLRPFTDELPKPLLPVAHRPQIEFVLELLRLSGVTDVVINLHQLAEPIRSRLGARYRDLLRIDYSVETELLGTGGGLKKVEDFFNEDPFILINADTLMDLDLEGAIRRHIESGAAATMVVREWEEGAGLGRVEMDEEGRIRRMLERGAGEGLTPVIFTGVHVLSRKIFDYLPAARFSCINRDGYRAMLEAGERVFGFRASGYWRDVGTLASYFDANMDLIHGRMPACAERLVAPGRETDYGAAMPGVEFVPPVIMGRGCRIERGCRIGPAVVLGDCCHVGGGCRLERVVALSRAAFHSGELVNGCIRSEAASVSVRARGCERGRVDRGVVDKR